MKYATQTEAQIFCDTFNKFVLGRTARWVRVGPCEYIVSIVDNKSFERHFFALAA